MKSGMIEYRAISNGATMRPQFDEALIGWNVITRMLQIYRLQDSSSDEESCQTSEDQRVSTHSSPDVEEFLPSLKHLFVFVGTDNSTARYVEVGPASSVLSARRSSCSRATQKKTPLALDRIPSDTAELVSDTETRMLMAVLEQGQTMLSWSSRSLSLFIYQSLRIMSHRKGKLRGLLSHQSSPRQMIPAVEECHTGFPTLSVESELLYKLPNSDDKNTNKIKTVQLRE
ncbi:hypothetical protein RRG08_051035 [Elysia crispata]|uniref:Uncharacterized protein n=1 Tax=Elysia crispata TaxID=231223 RepID=A0AAE0Z6K7_9GAST|nr:hypothetical protein RRG08_051035 [Elysia crispata]